MPSTSPTEWPRLYTAKEVASELKRDVRTIYRWLKSGKINGHQFGYKGGWRIDETVVRQMLAHLTRGSVKQPAKKGLPRSALLNYRHRCICPHCNTSKQQIKAGRNRSGSQRFLCQVCRHSYTLTPALNGYSKDDRKQALHLYRKGKSLRYIGQHFSVNPQTVLNWVNAANLRRPAKVTHRL